jgi:hypothetical protein
MFQILFNGKQYLIARSGQEHAGWSILDHAATQEDALAKCGRDWGYYWDLCGVVPDRAINVVYS